MKSYKYQLPTKKIIFGVIVPCILMLSWIILSLNYYSIMYGTQTHPSEFLKNPYNNTDIFATVDYNGTENFLIDTPGCLIPNYAKTLNFKEAKIIRKSCGVRAVFLEKISDEYFTVRIDEVKMKQYSKNTKNYDCCYQFITPNIVLGRKDYTKIRYTHCETIKNGTKIKLKEEIIGINCAIDKPGKQIIYRDVYILVKKLKRKKIERPLDTWNVLIVGVDTMSRSRLINSMPRTAKYLHAHHWLDFRGYQKVGFNTFPNVMAMMSGKNTTEVNRACKYGMDRCNNMMLWSNFEKAGYYTATGEEYLRLPDTFTRYNGFQTPPTDHYLRPLFLTGEEMVGNLICTKKQPSAKHLLDYTYDFSKTYINDDFFGMFWMNSFSHNLQNVPSLIDADIVEFFKAMNKSGVLNNTFVFFLSDHGIRYGQMRLPYESYYEERLPMLYIWVPLKFRYKNYQMYRSLVVNQNRLVTPYDVYITILSILEISLNNKSVATSDACPKCSSMLNELTVHRTCANAGVLDKWCSCYDIVEVEKDNPVVLNALHLAIEYIQEKIKSIKTDSCSVCQNLELKTIIRAHKYEKSENVTMFILALKLRPGDVSYEANIEYDGDQFRVIDPTETISTYNTRGNCVENPADRAYCVCKKVKCEIKIKIRYSNFFNYISLGKY